MNQLERINETSDEIVDILVRGGISLFDAKKYAEKFTVHFIEYGALTKDGLDELVSLKKGCAEGARITVEEGVRITVDIAKVCSKYALTYAERARLYLETDAPKDLSEDEARQFEEDLKAMNDYEALCSGGCPVTDEHRELYRLLAQGITPGGPSKVTTEEIDQFRVLAKKFGISDVDVENHIADTLDGINGQMKQILKQQRVIDKRMERNHRALVGKNHSLVRRWGLTAAEEE